MFDETGPTYQGASNGLEGAAYALAGISQNDPANNLARAAAEGGNYDSAIDIYRQKIAANPGDFSTRLALADTLMQARALDEAKRLFTETTKLRPWSAAPYVGLGRIALAQGRPHEANAYFLDATAREPDDFESLNGLAVSRDYLGQHHEAQALYASLLRRAPDDLRVKSNLGLSMALAGRTREAVNYLLGFASAPTAPRQARHNLAMAYALSGNMRAAREIMGLDLSSTQIEESLRFMTLASGVNRCAQGRASCGRVVR